MLNSREVSILLFAAILSAKGVLAQEVGQQLFTSTCASCHGLDGRGGEHAPNIASDPRIQAFADRDLLRVVKAGVPANGMPAFGNALNDDQVRAVVAYLRILQGKAKTASVQGDAANGRVLFFGRAHCSECHMIHGEGGFLGADLSAYAGTHAPNEIREAIVLPDRNQDPRRGTIVVTLKTGIKYTGVIRNEDNFSLQMQTADGRFHFFDKSNVSSVQHLRKPLMPGDYRSLLGDKGIDDLVAYLAKVGASSDSPRSGHDEDE